MENKKQATIINFTDKAYDRSETSAHCNRIVVENQYEPEDYIIQRHLNNMIAMYGRKFVAEVIHNMNLDDYSFNKQVG